MKLVRFGEPGAERPGLLDSEGRVRDLSGVIADINGAALDPETLDRLRALDADALPLAPDGARLGPCVGGVGHFIAVGLNYADHAAEAGLTPPAEPILFSKAPSCIIGPHDDVLIPPGSTRTDWEVELAVVIGSPCSRVSEAEALEHVAGYCLCNDISERAWQNERGGTWMKGKGAPTFGPLGPWLATREELGDANGRAMWLDLNGERMQTGNTENMIFRVPFIVSYISQFMDLRPGDVIATGTPPGVGMGRKPPLFLKAGDRMTLGIDGLGVQDLNVRDASRQAAA